MIDQNFYKGEGLAQSLITFHLPKMKCLNIEEPINLFGNFDSSGGQFLAIFHASCDLLNIATCKTPDEVTEWLKHKYILLYYTEDAANEQDYGESISFSKFVH